MSTASCSRYPVVEAANAQLAGQRALDAGAEVYAPEEYNRYRSSMVSAKENLQQQQLHRLWFRDYRPVRDVLNGAVDEAEEAIQIAVQKQIVYRQKVSDDLQKIKDAVNEIRSQNRWLTTQPSLRRSVVTIDLAVAVAESLWHSGRYDRASSYLTEASDSLATLKNRADNLEMKMNDSKSLSNWNRLVKTTIERSATEHRIVLIVNKYRHTLTAYKSGYRVAEYRVDLGLNAYVPKRLHGDGATPEGRYYVTRKLEGDETQYHKALMVNYPNTEDYRAFRLLQKGSRKRLRIGGDIGFHGGGGKSKDWTLGCIALENDDIDDMFPLIPVGTPVTIVANETIQSERIGGR
jgi:L,D-peptidoglycan transpeptidase YkuD (ErfK/YbiS/YcfS/YnhG family)